MPVYDGTTGAVLDLAAARFDRAALPASAGNIGMTAHRDGFSRVPKELRGGDALVLDTPATTEERQVNGSGSPRRPTSTRSPRRPAPQRFVVRAVPVKEGLARTPSAKEALEAERLTSR